MSSCNDGSIAFAISMGFLSLTIVLVLIANPVAEEDKIDTSYTLNYLISMFKDFYDAYWYVVIPFGIIIIVMPFLGSIYQMIDSIRELMRKTPQQTFQKVDEK